MTSDEGKISADKAGTGGFRFSPGNTPEAQTRGPRPAQHSKELLDVELDTDFDREERLSRASGFFSIQEIREQRLPCSFPGMLKILIPEKSFVPSSLAVRVANLSASGAMVEVHDASKVDKDIALANRFFELKVAHPEIPVLRGAVAWSDMGGVKPLLGLSCFEKIPELAEVVLATESSEQVKLPPPLPYPKLESYPQRTDDPVATIFGEAPEAITVIAKDDLKKYTATVDKGRFELKLDLSTPGENHFSLRSYAGERKSRAVPIRILYEKKGAVATRSFHLDTKRDEDGNNLIDIEFTGSVQQAERILYRFSQLMSMSEKVSIVSQLVSPGEFDKRLYDALRAEGKMLADDDTKRGDNAAKLLGDLLE